MGDAFRAGDTAKFLLVTREYAAWLNTEHPEWAGRTTFELRFNHIEPFYGSMVLYVVAFLLACFSWLAMPQGLRKTAFLLLLLAFAIHSFGMFARMYIQGRPPVTNLYSSAIFVGWGAVLLGIVLERMFKDGIGSAASGVVGFTTLVIAHHLGTSGDTLEMMQAVLDSNFLARHPRGGHHARLLGDVPRRRSGIVYVCSACSPAAHRDAAKALSAWFTASFASPLLFNFVGTVLGGIWADQSWGRFWGWDPKENGALLIVLWCALILHARWGGYIRERGIMAMAIVRQRHHRLLMVRRQHARRRPPFLRLHGQGLPMAHRLRDFPVPVRRAQPPAGEVLAQFPQCPAARSQYRGLSSGCSAGLILECFARDWSGSLRGAMSRTGGFKPPMRIMALSKRHSARIRSSARASWRKPRRWPDSTTPISSVCTISGRSTGCSSM
jgi:hypothetical protein